MAITFFKAVNEGYYVAIEKTTRDEETYQWLLDRHMPLGRMSSFEIQQESPVFDTFAEAEKWLIENWHNKTNWNLDYTRADEDALCEPSQENYTRCAQIATESNEILASGQLGMILDREKNHSYCCSIGVWYWTLGHKALAVLAYERSIEIQPEAATYFNLAVC
ncbi:MAG: hypothetical protein HN368_17520 [Spirochaetales bacterium]|mgnify:CR=1 FL=1|nr:hypothetical protein [Spirochaetales bacterium]